MVAEHCLLTSNYTKAQLIFPGQQMVVLDQMDHPVHILVPKTVLAGQTATDEKIP